MNRPVNGKSRSRTLHPVKLKHIAGIRDKEEVCAFLKSAYDSGGSDPEAINADFLCALGEVIKRSGMAISFLASRTGITKQHLYRLIKGKRNPTMSTLRAILKELQIDIRFTEKSDQRK